MKVGVVGARLDLNSFADRTIPSCESTNDLCRELGDADYPHGTWVSSKTQTKGRGRMGRNWISEEGNLFLSVVLRDVPSNSVSWIPHFISLLLCESLASINAVGIPIIKWPNDVGVTENGKFKKAAGILCEGVSSGSQFFVVVGVGVNCITEVKTDQETHCWKISSDQLRESFLARLKAFSWNDQSYIDRQKIEYESRSLLKAGKSISWYSLSQPEKTTEGLVAGIGAHGELLVKTNDGRSMFLLSEEVKIRI
jgi:BirA family transcriptional regulator, biotin operon repressor / biotin---[acetyl-CoA-carboxylase] ligase